MENVQRDFIGEISHKYPKKWIVVTNLGEETRHEILDDGKKIKLKYSVGDVYFVANSYDEAWDTFGRLGDKKNRAMVLEGFNDTPQIGGVFIHD